jgi:hypothetical protein
MITNIYRGAALVFAMALGATSAISHAASAYSSNQAVHENFNTSIQSLFGLDYPWTGTLQLTFNPDGIINGYYRPADNMQFIPVTGGRNGHDIWLDIGSTGRLHVNGTLENGNISGAAFDPDSKRQYKFNATPSK